MSPEERGGCGFWWTQELRESVFGCGVEDSGFGGGER
jgi:hypothetical protein